MKVSTKGRYALRFMAELARLDKGARMPIKEVSEKQGLSEKYLEQIVRALKNGDLVIGTRGAQGGYALARDASEITVGEVLRLTEGDLAPVQCVSDEQGDACSRADSCETIFVWRKLKEATDKVVNGITIADLKEKGGGTCAASTAARIDAITDQVD